MLDYAKLAATPLERDPYDWMVVPEFIRPESFGAIVRDYPSVPGPGSHPPSVLNVNGRFAEMMTELDGPRFRELVEEKFGLDLSDRPTMYTVRGYCRPRDGAPHTDSKTKITTVLLYMNDAWDNAAGRLRILRGGDSLDDYAAEVPPSNGALLLFRRSDNSWHGHHPFDGPRRVVQMNWVISDGVVSYEQRRHRVTSRFKRFKRFLGLK